MLRMRMHSILLPVPPGGVIPPGGTVGTYHLMLPGSAKVVPLDLWHPMIFIRTNPNKPKQSLGCAKSGCHKSNSMVLCETWACYAWGSRMLCMRRGYGTVWVGSVRGELSSVMVIIGVKYELKFSFWKSMMLKLVKHCLILLWSPAH